MRCRVFWCGTTRGPASRDVEIGHSLSQTFDLRLCVFARRVRSGEKRVKIGLVRVHTNRRLISEPTASLPWSFLLIQLGLGPCLTQDTSLFGILKHIQTNSWRWIDESEILREWWTASRASRTPGEDFNKWISRIAVVLSIWRKTDIFGRFKGPNLFWTLTWPLWTVRSGQVQGLGKWSNLNHGCVRGSRNTVQNWTEPDYSSTIHAWKEYCIPSLLGYAEGIITRDASILFSELSPMVVHTISNCTTSECLAAYARGNWPLLSFEFTSMLSCAKRSFIISKCPFLAAYESGERLYPSFEFTLMLSCAKRSFVTSEFLFLAVYESGERPSHHSVRISDRYVDNTLTLYRLRRHSGRLADYTLYLCYTGRRNDIQYV